MKEPYNIWDYKPYQILLIFFLAKDRKKKSVQVFVASSSF